MKLGGKNKRSSRYVNEITGPGRSLWESWWDFQCFGEFGAFERARKMKIGRRVRNLHTFAW